VVKVNHSVALNTRLLMTVSEISPSERLITGILLMTIGLVLLRFMPAIHERYFGQYKSSRLQTVGGPIFVIVMGALLVIGGAVQLF